MAVYGYGLSSISGGSEPVRVNIAVVSSDFFKALGVEPFRGRPFAPEEQRLHGAPAMIVSYGYWQRYLGGAADLSKFHLAMEGGGYPGIGAIPAGIGFSARVAPAASRGRGWANPRRAGHQLL